MENGNEATVNGLRVLAESTKITRVNVDRLLDQHRIETAMKSGAWWAIRRNGQTQVWKRDARRIRIPYKCGFKGYGVITESDFLPDGRLDPQFYRMKEG